MAVRYWAALTRGLGHWGALLAAMRYNWGSVQSCGRHHCGPCLAGWIERGQVRLKVTVDKNSWCK